MNVNQKSQNEFEVESSFYKDKFYKVDLAKKVCSCPWFIYNCKSVGTKCKHIIEAEQFVMNNLPVDDALAFVRKHDFVDSLVFIDKFGDQTLNQMISRGDLYEKRGVVREL